MKTRLTVMVARVFRKVEGWEIYLSNSVHDVCFGKGYFSTNTKGDYELKGFDNLVRIFFCERRAEL